MPVLAVMPQSAQSAEAATLGAHLFYLLREMLRTMSERGLEFDDALLQQRAKELTKLQVRGSPRISSQSRRTYRSVQGQPDAPGAAVRAADARHAPRARALRHRAGCCPP